MILYYFTQQCLKISRGLPAPRAMSHRTQIVRATLFLSLRYSCFIEVKAIPSSLFSVITTRLRTLDSMNDTEEKKVSYASVELKTNISPMRKGPMLQRKSPR